jgi:hypothetical protein
MKTRLLKLITALAFTTPAFAHQDIVIGANGGRIFDLGSETTPHLEVAAKDGKFVVYVLDGNGKPLLLGERTLTVTAGERSKPEKLAVEKSGESFTAPIPQGTKFPVVFQIREKEGAKPLTARMNYNSNPCPECKEPEWKCACGSKEPKKK